ncbi:hypothetical protein ACIP6T_08140 [Pantoea sp. NPDC088449]|uniref:hypothetical protein n=1 Tax=Pantoea sp. NPDC088449 TaxID=3364392 RepID=UPI000ED05122|nr:hypothetical protein [Pantoea sp.]
MTVNRSILKFINLPMLLLFIGGFAAAIGGFVIHTMYTSPLKSQCVMPVSFYDIKQGKDVALLRGSYRSYRDSISRGHVTFVGSLSRFSDGQRVGQPVTVNRELRFEGSITHNLLQMTITGHNRRIGDQSSDDDVSTYVFPALHNGESGTTSLYLLDGKVMATGVETVARIACMN